jgi:hypothetical protein
MTGVGNVTVDLQETYRNWKKSKWQQRNRSGQEGWSTCGKWASASGTGRKPAYTLRLPHHALTVITERAVPSLVTGLSRDISYLVTVDTGVYVIVARPDIAARWPERQPNQLYTLQTISGKPYPSSGSFLDTGPGAAPTEILDILCQYHKRVCH